MAKSEQQIRYELSAQETANKTGEAQILFARTCDRFMVRPASDTGSADTYASRIAHFSPQPPTDPEVLRLLERRASIATVLESIQNAATAAHDNCEHGAVDDEFIMEFLDLAWRRAQIVQDEVTEKIGATLPREVAA